MAALTEEELTNDLDEEIAWRKRELSNLSRVLLSAREHEQRVILRGAVCILYAHWEGFIKNAAQKYLEFVSARRLKYGQLKRNFWIVGLQSTLKTATQANRASVHLNLLNNILVHGENKFRKSSVSTVETSSNLNSSVLADILTTLGFNPDDYLDHKALLDERLLRNRNSIAHGRDVFIESDDYAALRDVVLALMDRFKDDIQNAAAMKSYRAL